MIIMSDASLSGVRTNYYFTVTGAETDEGKRTAVYNKRGVMDGVQDYYNFKFLSGVQDARLGERCRFLSDFYRSVL